MPELPTITVTPAQAAKLVEVFGSATEYRVWLRAAIRHEVAQRHARALQDAHDARLASEPWVAADEVLNAEETA